MTAWTDHEKAFLTECANAKIGARDIGRLLGRPDHVVRMKRYQMGLPPPGGFKKLRTTSGRGSASVSEIKAEVARHFEVPAEKMTAGDRSRKYARPRQVAMFFAREVAFKTYPQIAQMFGGMDHTTVIHAHRTISRLIDEDVGFKHTIQTLKSALSSEEEKEISALPKPLVENPTKPAFVHESAGA